MLFFNVLEEDSCLMKIYAERELVQGGAMISRMRWILLLLIAGMAVTGCKSKNGTEAEATLSSQDVIHTAEAIAEATRSAITPTQTRMPITPTVTTPPMTPTPSETATPGMAMATANYNANVRTGPGEEYDWVDFFLAEQVAELLGRYDNPSSGTWWYLRRIEIGLDGWVWGGAVTLAGDTSGVPYLEPPPTPTSTPKPTNPPAPTDTPTP